MKGAGAFKYYSPLILYAGAFLCFTLHGIVCYFTLIYAWAIIPALELLLKPDHKNLSSGEEAAAMENKWYDFILYTIVVLQVPILFLFFHSMQDQFLSLPDKIARIGTMGLLCGTFGINVGHELGHRTKKYEQWLAKTSLLTSLYMHFFIEHNKGHHKNVATPEDPSSARMGEAVYLFYFRTIYFSYVHAWKIANSEMRKKNKPLIDLQNEMIQYHLIETAMLFLIGFLFGLKIMAFFLIAAFIGILLLETVNYIEHYGLSRKKIADGKYERPIPHHSWNSDHVIGRLMLFELSRHSDHHYLASRKYQILRHHEKSPQMPTGYPGMMILSLVPPLWFYVMNRKIKSF
ncbi:MAG: alkane 1-monooxygenase [Bacteroidetes bacterium]|nr:alkane 1-monooxygenase [Bacteroidota bacterium]MBS1973102.1 alkane 1-monooxygenase [Bacteroidota bacterium]